MKIVSAPFFRNFNRKIEVFKEFLADFNNFFNKNESMGGSFAREALSK